MSEPQGAPGTVSPDGHWVWDGARWTPNTPVTPPVGSRAPSPAGSGPIPPTPRRRRNAIILGCAGLIGLFVVLAVIGALAGGSGTTTTARATPHPSERGLPSPSIASTSSLPPSTAPSTAPAPVVPPPPAPATLAVHITASTYGHVAATTSPGATCTAEAILPSGNKSTAAGLQVAQTAGAGGTVDWTYRITTRTGKGTGTHTVSCQLNGQSATDSAPFVV